MLEKINKIVNIVLSSLIVLSLIIILSAGISLKKGNVPSVFGYSFSIVLTPSMEPTIMTNELVISKTQDEYCVVDIISFYDYEQDTKISKTHRIVDQYELEGVTYYITKGDANSNNDSKHITEDDIIGKIIYHSVSLGSIFSFKFLRNPKNLLLIVIIALIIFMISQISNIVRLVKESKQ